MPITVACICGKIIVVNEALAGQPVYCMRCRRQVEVPLPPPPPTEEEKQATLAAIRPTSRDYLYWFLVLALIPLFLSPFFEDDPFEKRLERAVQNHPELKKAAEQFDEEKISLDELLDQFPANRLDGAALLPQKTWVHWVYAGVSAGLYFALIYFLFSQENWRRENLIWVGFFTATIGTMFLLLAQEAAVWSHEHRVVFAGVLTPILWIVKFIGFSYACAAAPDADFGTSFFGFTFGVGLCEELCKAAPLLWFFRRGGVLTWRRACLWGLASGIGFGVSEGVAYSSDFYNGVSGVSDYVIRFASCVALHGMWAASVGMTLSGHFQFLNKPDASYAVKPWEGTWQRGTESFIDVAFPLFGIMSFAMILHGLYDTFLKMNMDFSAILTALATFALFAWQIETRRSREANVITKSLETAPAAARQDEAVARFFAPQEPPKT